MQTAGYSLLCLFWGSLLVLLATARPGARLGRIFESRALRHLGRYGYGLYLVHLPAASVLAQIYPRAALVRHFVLAQTVYWALSIAFAYALARATWAVIEAPALSLKRYFPYRR
jgi:peptidoglycan/LPS O-acetylase OafA/YrhL